MKSATAKVWASTAIIISLLTVGFAGNVEASDGVTEINMAAATAGGITPGDAPGLPVTIDTEGSYILTGNMTTASANVTVIEIDASYVTIDLNGFTISGPDLIGSGNGISAGATDRHVEVRNGLIRGMGNGGLRLPAADARAINLRVYDNGDDGIQLGSNGVAKNCTASHNGDIGIVVSTGSSLISNYSNRNGADTSFGGGLSVGNGGFATGNVSRDNFGEGIVAGRGATLVDNTVYENTEDGIRSGEGSLLRSNTARDNDKFGLNMGPNSGYGGNVLTGNGSGAVSGGTQISDNFCNTNTVCP